MDQEEITTMLARLPSGLAEMNVESWQKMVQFFGEFEHTTLQYKWVTLVSKLVNRIAYSETAKLFRAGQMLYFCNYSGLEGLN